MRFVLSLIALAMPALLLACGSSGSEPAPTPSPASTATPTVTMTPTPTVVPCSPANADASTDPAFLQRCANRGDPVLQSVIDINTSIAANRSTPPDVLAGFFNPRQSSGVLCRVMANPSTPLATLQAHAAEFGCVAANPGAPLPILCSYAARGPDNDVGKQAWPAILEKTGKPWEEACSGELTTPTPTLPTPAGPRASFGNGVWRVGSDIAAGTYRTEGGRCYWARLRGFGGTAGEIFANGILDGGPGVVTIASSDAGFEASGGCFWAKQ